jgi:cell division protein ZapA (FtsZ GTPase activity inhibitor)
MLSVKSNENQKKRKENQMKTKTMKRNIPALKYRNHSITINRMLILASLNQSHQLSIILSNT